jgi:inner membrane protein involved in colicin E2 resistance
MVYLYSYPVTGWSITVWNIGLFILLAIVMYYSRKIDWYGEGKKVSATETINENTTV